MVGDLVVAPLLFVWSARPPLRWTPGRAGEAVTLLLSVTAASLCVFDDVPGSPVLNSPSIPFPLLIWAALRFGPPGAVTATFLVSAIAIRGTALGHGPFARAALSGSLLALQTFTSVAAVTMLILAGGVSERRHADAAVRQARGDLERRVRERTAELTRTNTGLLEEIAERQRAEAELSASRQELQTRLLDDLLSVSRLAYGKITLHFERLDLVRLVRDTAEDHRHALDEEGLTLDLELPTGPLFVRGDRTRLAQVLDNLLNNAAKFTESGGRVGVGCRVVGSGGSPNAQPSTSRTASITVRDTGVGISPEMLPQVFDRFAQADRSLDRSRGGLGLGLALVKGLVERHGGRVQAESDGPGQGTAVTLYLPMEPNEGARERGDRQTDSDSRRRGIGPGSS